MDEKRSTIRQTDAGDSDEQGETLRLQPGIVAVFFGGKAQWLPIPIPCSVGATEGSESGEIELGRNNLGSRTSDGRISGRHARVSYRNGSFSAADLGSLNGTSIDGQPVPANSERPLKSCLRIGDTLLLPVPDLNAFKGVRPTVRNGIVIGPRLSNLYQRISRLATASQTLNITGESGAGKENAARSFHTSSSANQGPFIAVNCATIPEGIAERLLFGARRGAFSGVTADSEGYIQAAHNGTLFLDEVAELHASVQAKLLRVLETREVLALGALRPQPVNLRVCSASHRSLAAEVAAGRLREDLYYRIGRPSERVPALRERGEEIPWLLHGELERVNPGLSLHASFVEACLLRHWPGNVRELLVELRTAVQEASAGSSPRLRAEHLSPSAGLLLKPELPSVQPTPSVPPSESSPAVPAASSTSPEPAAGPAREPGERLSQPQLIAVLLEAKCNVSEAARRLGMHRTQLRRQIEQYGIEIERLRQLEK